MKDIRIHIANESVYIDENVFLDIKLPDTPRVGEIVFLNQEQKEKLEEQAKKNHMASAYAPKWFYGESLDCTVPEKKNLKDLCFDDARIVHSVTYFSESEIIHIELDS